MSVLSIVVEADLRRYRSELREQLKNPSFEYTKVRTGRELQMLSFISKLHLVIIYIYPLRHTPSILLS